MSTQILNNNKSSIVINATKVSFEDNIAEIYEFVLNANLKVIACSYIESVSQGRTRILPDFNKSLNGILFEINHVRIDPTLNNELVLHRLRKALQQSGVVIKMPPDEILMAICYKPLGELESTVRFYLKNQDHLVFLSQTAKLSLV